MCDVDNLCDFGCERLGTYTKAGKYIIARGAPCIYHLSAMVTLTHGQSYNLTYSPPQIEENFRGCPSQSQDLL
jgi:hypothetical protein